MINLLSLSEIGLILTFYTLSISIDAMNTQGHFNLQFIRHTSAKENFRFLVLGYSLIIKVPNTETVTYIYTIPVYLCMLYAKFRHVFVVCFDKLLFNRRILMFSYNSPFIQ